MAGIRASRGERASSRSPRTPGIGTAPQGSEGTQREQAGSSTWQWVPPWGCIVPVLHRYHCHTAQVSQPYPRVTLRRSHSTTGATTVSVRQQRYSHSPPRVTPYRSCRLPCHRTALPPARCHACRPRSRTMPGRSGATMGLILTLVLPPQSPGPAARPLPAGTGPRSRLPARDMHGGEETGRSGSVTHGGEGPGQGAGDTLGEGNTNPPRPDPRCPRSDLQRRPRAGRAASGYIASTGGAGPRVASNQRRRRRVQPHVASNQRRHRFRPMRCVQSAAAPPRRGGRKRGAGGSGAHGGHRGGSRR